MELSEVTSLLQGGGTPALIIAVYFIYKLEARMARIEKAFEIVAQHLTSKVDKQ